jgi:hypothetical protein
VLGCRRFPCKLHTSCCKLDAARPSPPPPPQPLGK